MSHATFGTHFYRKMITVSLDLEIECPVFHLTTLFPPDSLRSDSLHPIATSAFCLASYLASQLPANLFEPPASLRCSRHPLWEAGMDSSHPVASFGSLGCRLLTRLDWVLNNVALLRSQFNVIYLSEQTERCWDRIGKTGIYFQSALLMSSKGSDPNHLFLQSSS